MWDQRYNRDGYVYGTQPNDFLRQQASSIPRGQVLCLAEGEGRNAVFLAQQGYRVVAVDSSAVGLRKAQQLADKQGVEIETVHADLTDFVIEENSWDGIVSIFCHVPPSIRRPLHQQVVRGLRERGVLLLEAYTPRQISYKTGGPPVPELTMQLSELRDELAGLQFHHAIEMDRDVIEGEFHTGLGAVVQLNAVKS